jgi:hypothetical protein
MIQKITTVTLVSIVLFVIFCVVFFHTTPLSPKPVKIEDTKSYFDVQDKPIMYKLIIVGNVEYSKWYNPWKRDRFEDSLKVSNQRIMDDYFQTNYLNRVSDDTIINTFDVSKYFSSDLSFDSVYFQIVVEKKITLTGKPPL